MDLAVRYHAAAVSHQQNRRIIRNYLSAACDICLTVLHIHNVVVSAAGDELHTTVDRQSCAGTDVEQSGHAYRDLAAVRRCDREVFADRNRGARCEASRYVDGVTRCRRVDFRCKIRRGGNVIGLRRRADCEADRQQHHRCQHRKKQNDFLFHVCSPFQNHIFGKRNFAQKFAEKTPLLFYYIIYRFKLPDKKRSFFF